MNPEVNWFFSKSSKWQEAYNELRDIVLSFELKEDLKWGCPCYTIDNNNVVLIHGFKDYCALLFMKGTIMEDPKSILVQQTENVQSSRQIRFKTLDEIINQKDVLKSYIKNAIEIEKSGVKIEMKKTTDYKIPDEFQSALNEMSELKTAFENLSPGRQNGYLLYFFSAKQSKTRSQRIEKYIPKIIDGKGLKD